MALRDQIAEAANLLKAENDYSYTRMCNDSGLTRKQISAILKGRRGISMEKIEEFFDDVFGVELCLIVQKTIK